MLDKIMVMKVELHFTNQLGWTSSFALYLVRYPKDRVPCNKARKLLPPCIL